jgi:hypothetical protein
VSGDFVVPDRFLLFTDDGTCIAFYGAPSGRGLSAAFSALMVFFRFAFHHSMTVVNESVQSSLGSSVTGW